MTIQRWLTLCWVGVLVVLYFMPTPINGFVFGPLLIVGAIAWTASRYYAERRDGPDTLAHQARWRRAAKGAIVPWLCGLAAVIVIHLGDHGDAWRSSIGNWLTIGPVLYCLCVAALAENFRWAKRRD